MVTIERLSAYSTDDSIQIGKLMPLLSKRFTDSPIPESLLTEIINSPYHEQIVARDESGSIVGAATLSETIGLGDGHEGLLDDFAVNPNIQGQGIGHLIWREIMAWCREKNISELVFTSRPQKVAANRFYLKHGAVVHESTIYKVKDFS
ncbi:MAG: GNAT family N-acetyltransferase [Candidatus Saccharimonadales bacterium]